MSALQAQGSLEYILIVGAGILIAALAVTMATTVGTTTVNTAERTLANAECAKFGSLSCSSQTVQVGENSYSCALNAQGNKCFAVFGLTENTVVATLVATDGCTASGGNGPLYFLTITNYDTDNLNFGGKLHFTLDPGEMIPSSATNVSATLTLHESYALGDCTFVDPLYFYTDEDALCVGSDYTAGSGLPGGSTANDDPTPNDCSTTLPLASKTFEIGGAIDRDTTELFIEVRGSDVGGLQAYRGWAGSSDPDPSKHPTLEITYDS